MTKTIQVRSSVLINNVNKSVTTKKPETEDNIGLMLALYDSLNTLCEKLNRLDYLLNRKRMELILYENGKGEAK